MYNSVLASFVDIEKNMTDLMDDKNLNELFDDIKIISKSNFTNDGLEGLKSVLINSGVQYIIDYDHLYTKIKKGQSYAILNKKLFEFSILCNFMVINKERKMVLLKKKNDNYKIPLLTLKPDIS